MNNVPLIKIKKKVSGKINQAIMIISIFCALNNIKLSDAEKTALSYFLVYGINDVTKNLIIKAKTFDSYDTIKNLMTKFRKKSLIKKVNKVAN